MIEHAKWIAPAGAEKYTPCHFRVEKSVSLKQKPERLLLQIACDGNYCLEINGQLAGRGSASLCHGFSSAPAAFLQTAVLGIRPIEPGFTHFAFAPLTTGIGFAQGRVPTPHGTIRCKWMYANGKYSATLYVPENCTACTPAGEFTAGNWVLEWKDSKI